ncbi:hypothetical protein SDC9_197967 [bioreactor metagenome]|uniref:Uncharacterized protein n=1 Tax=bioreactor metagenome TaxID=1076179 RepID=A0A645IGA9_9ZZZZ
MQMLTHTGDKRRGEPGLYLLTFEIQHVLSGWACIPGTARQAQHAVFFLPHIAQRFQRWGG